MDNSEKERPIHLDRREILKLGMAASAISLITPPLRIASAAPGATHATAEPGAGRVIKVHMPNMRGKAFPHAEAAKQMVERAVTTLAGEPDVKKA